MKHNNITDKEQKRSTIISALELDMISIAFKCAGDKLNTEEQKEKTKDKTAPKPK